MVQYKRAYLLLAAVLLFSTGKLWADNPTPVATSTTPAAVKPSKHSPEYDAMVAANDLAAAGKTDEAIAAYEKIGVLKSKNMEAWRLNNEAHAYLTAATPVPDKAVPLLEKAVAANDANYVAWNNLGSAYELTDQLDKAKDAYQKSIDSAKAANASSAKAEGNLQALQAKLDKNGDDKPDAAGNSPAASK
jgi:tetratricopeptide (TPR) repeat protein